jgi:hypothetical protein
VTVSVAWSFLCFSVVGTEKAQTAALPLFAPAEMNACTMTFSFVWPEEAVHVIVPSPPRS